MSINNRAVKISQNIRKLRDMKGLSQEYVAEQLDLSQSAYSKLELGKIQLTADMLKKIADVLEVNEKLIEEFSDSFIFNDHSQCAYSGDINNTDLQSLEKIEALYKTLVDTLKQQVQQQAELIQILKNK